MPLPIGAPPAVSEMGQGNMDRFDATLANLLARRRLLASGAAALAGGAIARAAGGFSRPAPDAGLVGRPVSASFPQKGAMIVQRNRPPLLETPMEVFNDGVFTPNDRFFVRWHWADIPLEVDAAGFRLTIGGAVKRPLALRLDELLKMPRISYAAVNQCSGNSRALFDPRVPGAQWSHGAMGNARWEGVALSHLLELAGIDPAATRVRFGGLDKPLTAVDPFKKSLAVDHAMDGEVMVAFAMNGEQLPMLNGFPLRLIVPGWFSTYWVKSLDSIEVLNGPDDNYWMAKAYQVPTAPHANVVPGTKEFPKAPISIMPPRSWITNLKDGATLPYRPRIGVNGIALGGDQGIRSVDISIDGGKSWVASRLGPDEGRYSFRRFSAVVPVLAHGTMTIMSRCTNEKGEAQPMAPNWNPGGYMRNCVEACTVRLV